MEIRNLRLQTGLSQSKFAKMFDIPVPTLKDWEQERRNPPAYVVNMIRTILEYKGMLMTQVKRASAEVGSLWLGGWVCHAGLQKQSCSVG